MEPQSRTKKKNAKTKPVSRLARPEGIHQKIYVSYMLLEVDTYRWALTREQREEYPSVKLFSRMTRPKQIQQRKIYRVIVKCILFTVDTDKPPLEK